MCLYSLRGNEKVAHWGMTVCLINVDHLESEKGAERGSWRQGREEGILEEILSW